MYGEGPLYIPVLREVTFNWLCVRACIIIFIQKLILYSKPQGLWM